MDHVLLNPHTDAMQRSMQPRSALKLSKHCASQSSFGKTLCATLLMLCKGMRTTPFPEPSFPSDTKGKPNLRIVIITSHILDFEHLIEYPQLWLFLVACIISEPPPFKDLAVYMPLQTTSTKSLPSPRRRHRSSSVRSLVPGICAYSR